MRNQAGICRWVGGLAVAVALGTALPSGAAAQSGAGIYNQSCAACHQADGSGIPDMFPPIAQSEWVTGDPGRLIRIVLHGVQGEIEVRGQVYDGVMPPWAAALNDAQMAALLTYMRSNFGNKASAVTAAQVAAVRKATASRKTPWTVRELVLSAAPKK